MNTKFNITSNSVKTYAPHAGIVTLCYLLGFLVGGIIPAPFMGLHTMSLITIAGSLFCVPLLIFLLMLLPFFTKTIEENLIKVCVTVLIALPLVYLIYEHAVVFDMEIEVFRYLGNHFKYLSNQSVWLRLILSAWYSSIGVIIYYFVMTQFIKAKNKR